MRVAHVELSTANEFVAKLHRHHKPVRGHRFSIGAEDPLGMLIGVAIVGRPVARACDQINYVEVLRLCTDGTPNACSFLYAAAQTAAKNLGYKKIQTYILASEPGTSLKALKQRGWQEEAKVIGRDWNCPSRGGRRTDQPQEDKIRWAALL